MGRQTVDRSVCSAGTRLVARDVRSGEVFYVKAYDLARKLNLKWETIRQRRYRGDSWDESFREHRRRSRGLGRRVYVELPGPAVAQQAAGEEDRLFGFAGTEGQKVAASKVADRLEDQAKPAAVGLPDDACRLMCSLEFRIAFAMTIKAMPDEIGAESMAQILEALIANYKFAKKII